MRRNIELIYDPRAVLVLNTDPCWSIQLCVALCMMKYSDQST